MNLAPHETAFATIIVLLLFGLAVFFGRRQWQVLRTARTRGDLAAEDRTYLIAQSWRRLWGCGLMIALAGMIAGWYVLGLNHQAEELRRQGQEAAARDEAPGHFDPQQQHSINVFSVYWIVATLLLTVMLALAFTDLWAIRRYGLRHLRRLQADRRTALQQEIAVYRSQRNGHGTEDNGR